MGRGVWWLFGAFLEALEKTDFRFDTAESTKGDEKQVEIIREDEGLLVMKCSIFLGAGAMERAPV